MPSFPSGYHGGVTCRVTGHVSRRLTSSGGTGPRTRNATGWAPVRRLLSGPGMKSSSNWIKASLAAFVVMTLEGHDTQAAPPENPLSVTVTNTGANPVPVVGTVEVTNVPDVNI